MDAPHDTTPKKSVPGWLPPLLSGVIRTWGATWRLREQIPPALHPRRADRSQRFVYLLWHRAILLACHTYRGVGLCIGASQHGDGELAAQVAHRFGFKTARGSSTRGATRLVRSMLDFAATDPGDLALTPDGPKGPPFQTKPGALFLAAQLGWPVVPVALTARPRHELGSWDGFILPAPFAKVAVVTAEPLVVERSIRSAQLATLCREVDARMERAALAAEELAS